MGRPRPGAALPAMRPLMHGRFEAPLIIEAATALSLELTDRPRISRSVRLGFDGVTSTHLLISSERVLLLNDSATAIVFSSNGLRTVEQIARYLADENDVELVTLEVHAFLCELRRLRFIDLMAWRWAPAG